MSAGLVVYSQAENLYYSNALTNAQFDRSALDRGVAGVTKGKVAQNRRDREKFVNRIIGEAKEYYKSKNVQLENEKR